MANSGVVNLAARDRSSATARLVESHAQRVMLDFTIAICTYNGEQRLPAVLDCLQACYDCVPPDGQSPPAWEILVVDNNSGDRTADLVRDRQADPSFTVPLRYCCEARQGLAFARQRAIDSAQSTWVAFVDDDNLPEPDWVCAAYDCAQQHPEAGAMGGRVLPGFDHSPPAHFARIACFLSINDRLPEVAFRYEPARRLLPPGAGLVVRQAAWQACVPQTLALVGRVGNLQLASEDLEALIHLQKGGWQIWHNPKMQLRHQLPSQRLERAYLLKIVRGTGLARHRLRMVRLRPWQRPFFFLFHLALDLYRALTFYYRHRDRLDSDLSAACQMTFLTSSLISPFFLWRYFWQARYRC